MNNLKSVGIKSKSPEIGRDPTWQPSFTGDGEGEGCFGTAATVLNYQPNVLPIYVYKNICFEWRYLIFLISLQILTIFIILPQISRKNTDFIQSFKKCIHGLFIFTLKVLSACIWILPKFL